MHNLMKGFYSVSCYLCIYFLIWVCNALYPDVQRTAALCVCLMLSEWTGATGNEACVLSLLLILRMMWNNVFFFFTQKHNVIVLAFWKGFSHLKSWFCLSLPYREYLHDWLFSTSWELGFSRGWLGTLQAAAAAGLSPCARVLECVHSNMKGTWGDRDRKVY